jgi:hypothetical protein
MYMIFPKTHSSITHRVGILPQRKTEVNKAKVRSMVGLLKDAIEAINSDDEIFQAEWSLEPSTQNRLDVIQGRIEVVLEGLESLTK